MAENTRNTMNTGTGSGTDTNSNKTGDPNKDEIATIGESTDLSDAYQMVSDPVAHTAEAMGLASEGVSAGGEHDGDAGRDPEEYIEKQTGKGSIDNDNTKGFDIQGPSGRQQTQHPGSGEHHSESGN